jgi:FMN phosphatase YigB (HAD superfamily)
VAIAPTRIRQSAIRIRNRQSSIVIQSPNLQSTISNSIANRQSPIQIVTLQSTISNSIANRQSSFNRPIYNPQSAIQSPIVNRRFKSSLCNLQSSVMLKTVFLDAGGVLLFPNWTRVSEALARQGVFVEPAALADADPIARKQIDDGQTIASTTDAKRGWMFFNLILTAAGVPLSDATDAALTELHEYHRQQNLWELVPAGVVPALEALGSLGLRLTVVSNANGTLCGHMDRLGLSRYVHCVLDSCDFGVEKPDPRLFEIALERSGACASTTIHVGDLYQVDVVGARAAGLRGVLLDERGLYEGVDCPRVRSLGELVARIEAGEFNNS